MNDQNNQPESSEPISPAQAEVKLADLLADKDFAQRYTSGDAQAAEQLDRLQHIAVTGRAPAEPSKPVSDRSDEPRKTNRGPTAEELDTRAPFERDAAVPPTPTDYRDLIYPVGQEPKTDDEREMDASVRQWLHTSGATQQEAGSLWASATIDLRKLGAMDEKARDEFGKDSVERFNTTFGKEGPARLDAARAYIKEMDRKHPGVINFLDRTGLGNSLAVMFYADQAARKR